MKNLILLSLATYRLTLLLSEEEGPSQIFSRFRHWLGVVRKQEYKHVQGGIVSVETIEEATGFWSELIMCPFCLSGWIIIGLWAFNIKWLNCWLGVWGIVDLLLKANRRLTQR